MSEFKHFLNINRNAITNFLTAIKKLICVEMIKMPFQNQTQFKLENEKSSLELKLLRKS